MRRIFVAGIGTGIGKTVVSAILTEALCADYWKPVQAGNLGQADSDIVRELVSNHYSRVHPETYRLTLPMSPHAAAHLDGIEVSLSEMKAPKTDRTLIIEGCGGLLVPLSDQHLAIDLIKHFSCELLLVSQFYLGSINHTLLSLEALQHRNIEVSGIVFNGEYNAASAEAISHFGKVKVLASIPKEPEVNRDMVSRHAPLIREALCL